MNASMISLTVWRQDGAEAAGRWETFAVDASGEPTVLEAIERINRAPATTDGEKTTAIQYDDGAACGALVNGAPVVLSEARLSSGGESVVVEPLSVFPITQDLQVDRARFETDLAEAFALAPEGMDVEALVSPAMHSGVCMEACAAYRSVPEYVGPVVVHVLERSNRGPGGDLRRAERLEILMGERGVAHDRNTFSYADCCPEGAELVQSMGQAKRSAAFQWIRDFFQN
jgi:succinate dehydrogenase / fumarate reductase iron-sulfur subunit